ncbi:dihydropteroate synthase [Azospirillum fermentarium]|uniref:dihydropteroate synthase n=1 Tax=Azospirillum fermentarium TaxID=1233114 RepID=UPI002227D21C|nr:dihydropteroate synthase [Azospirillum fermentarium]MCW2246908.1 dihydropteroate synthase [Azospirillum fermentarium]
MTERRLYVRPTGLLPAGSPNATPAAPLAGGRFAFTLVDLTVREAARITARTTLPFGEARAWAARHGLAAAFDHRMALLTRPRVPFGGVDIRRPAVMGIVNVTPDSFSDGGDFFHAGTAIAHGEALVEAGADILDVGGESTRPGAATVTEDEEKARVLPVIRHFAARGVAVSVDTRHAGVMAAALDAGARIINDISGLAGDPASLDVVARADAPVVVMHMQGEPGTMQDDPRYDDAALDVFDWLENRVAACRTGGVPLDRIAVDPGIGFGKTVAHNLEILRATTLYHGFGCPLLIGLSRKRFIAGLSRQEPPKERLPGSLIAGFETLSQGAQILRVHDVTATVQARAVWDGLHPAG